MDTPSPARYHLEAMEAALHTIYRAEEKGNRGAKGMEKRHERTGSMVEFESIAHERCLQEELLRQIGIVQSGRRTE